MTFLTRPPAGSFGKSLVTLSLLAMAACDASFLHSVDSRREATDRGCPAPNDGAHDVALVLESNGSISVSWSTKATNADSFVVERQSSREPTWGEIGTVSTTTFTDSRVVLDEEYGYRISAVRAAGGSTCATPSSEPVTLRTIPRAAGGFDAAGTGVGQITVSWNDVNSFEDGYRVARTDAGGTRVTLPDIAANATTFSDSGVTPGGSYTYEIVAFNVSGVSTPASDTQRAVTPPTLAWTTPPIIGPQCTLEAFGSASYDAGASFGSAKGVIEGADVAGSATGFRGQIATNTSGPIDTAWVVDDSEGGQETLSRTLTIVQTPVTRSAPQRKAPGEDQVTGEGTQALAPTCADCGSTAPTSVSVSQASTCVVTSNGHVSCWGANGSNQLGHGDVGSAYRAVRPCAGGARTCANTPLELESIDTGYHSTCGVTADGHAVCWGYGYQMILGNGVEDDSAVPIQVCAAGNATSCTTPLTGVTQVSVGTRTACAVANGGEVWCWGRDLFSPGDFHMPEPVCQSGTAPCPTTRFHATYVAVGDTSACALTGGEVHCWGQTDSAIFGTDTAVESQTPKPVCLSGTGGTCSRLTGANQVAVGDDFACARRSDNKLWCWGENSDGQVADGTTDNRSVPAPACTDNACTATLANVQSFDLGRRHVCAVVTGGDLYCWGTNGYGQIGPDTDYPKAHADRVCEGEYATTCAKVTGVAGVATGAQESCIWSADGRIRCMGEKGASGNEEEPDSTGVLMPVCRDGAGPTCDPLTGVTRTTLGDGLGCALVGTALTCWGTNSNGNLAVPPAGSTAAPAEVQIGVALDAAPLTGVRLVQLADSFGCALKTDGSVWCWGSNQSGVLALSDSAIDGFLGYARPVCLSGTGSTCVPFSNAISLSVGYEHACVATADGGVYCWGAEYCGELGRNHAGDCADNSSVVWPRPQPVLGPSGSTPLGNVAEVAIGYQYSCVLVRDGGVMCFGNNLVGQLGHGFTDGFFPLPVAVVDRTSGDPVPIGNRVALRAGANDACAIGADGGLMCWGRDGCGELGNPQLTFCNGTFRTDARPVCAGGGACTPLTGVIDVAPGIDYTCVLKADGTVACWGSNTVGELGRGFDNQGQAETLDATMACATACNAPCSTQLTGVVAISAFYSHTCVVREDGAVYCWGGNIYEQQGTDPHGGEVEVCSAQVACVAGGGSTCMPADVGDVRVCNALNVVAP